MEKINCGVIGLGFFGEHHVDALKSIPIAEVVAVCTRRESRLKEIGHKYGVPKLFTNYKDLLADESIDMVSIVTPIKDHFSMAVDSLREGKHVFLEKPMASDQAECQKIIEEAKKTDKFLMVGHICRFDPVYALTKEQIDNGFLGRIISIYAKRNLNKDYTVIPLKNISALFGDGIHDLDLMLWFTEATPRTVYAQTQRTRPDLNFDDVGWAMFRFDNDCIGVIENIWCLPSNTPHAIDAQMEIIGERGAIYINNSGNNYMVIKDGEIKYPQSTYWPRVHGERKGFLKDELEYFLKCIVNNKRPIIITPEESMKAVHAIRMAEESAKTNRVINF